MLKFALVWGVAACAMCACSGPDVKLNETTEEGHKAEAAKERKEAAKEASLYNPEADRDRVIGPSGPAGTEGASGVLITVNPTAYHLADAEAHARHARQHERAAALLAKFEDAACKNIAPAERTTCPTLLSDALVSLPNGVRLHTGAKRLPTVLGNVRCLLAFTQAHGYDEEWLCPFAIKSVTAAAAPDQTGVDLTSSDPAAVKALQALIQLPFRGM